MTKGLPHSINLDSGLRIEDECVLLKDFDYVGTVHLDSDIKKTEHENLLNVVQIDDYMNDPVDEFDYLKIGLEFSKRLYNELRENYRRRFRITLSFKEPGYARQKIETHGGCVAKIHMVRTTCDDKFRVDKLDEFESEGIFVIE